MMQIKKYGNYDLHPVKEIKGYNGQAWQGAGAGKHLRDEMAGLLRKQGHVTVCLDFYPGVRKRDIECLLEQLSPDLVIDTEDCAKPESQICRELDEYITDDRVFGVMCHKKLDTLFDEEKIAAARRSVKNGKNKTVVIMGVGAGLVSRGDIYVYCCLTRWEAQLRFRAGMPNWHCTNFDSPILEKYKRAFFIEWRMADRYKKERYEDMDYVLETESKDGPKMISGEAFRAALRRTAQEPLRLEPYFDPGVWGGHWMQANFGLDPEKENYAWSFDGVPEENCINLLFGDVLIKIPAMDLVLYCPHGLLGERVHGRFGTEFPIRFDLLDTMGGGNLSLQVHPLTEYIQDTFGMHYTQDESYYLLDTDDEEETYVYLGVKSGIDKKEMEKDLIRAQAGEIEFPAEKYVNKVPVKRHDHILIPAGTVHCSGKDTMVLEISATPYIFTFKLWDWGRIGLDGLPRPVHIEHGMKNIQWDRDTEWVYENLVGQEEILEQGAGYVVEKTGLHAREFIDTYRYTLTEPFEIVMDDSVQVMNLTEGRAMRIESLNGDFEPFEVHYAETVIIPAAVKEYRIVPEDQKIRVIAARVRK